MAECILEGAEGRLVDIISSDLPDEGRFVELMASPWVVFPEGRFGNTSVNVGVASPYWDDRMAKADFDFRDLDGRSHRPRLSVEGLEAICGRMAEAGVSVSAETRTALDCLRRPARAEAALADWLRSIESAGDPQHMGRVCARVFVNSDLARDDPARMPMDCFVSFAPVPIAMARRMAAMVAAEVSAGDKVADYFFEDALKDESRLLSERELDVPEETASPGAKDAPAF